ncbi:serine/threonine-protein kinase [Kineosporia succinea]|uniref:Serine/threonine protein kinase n=1 Tax=Kineosporia succinea TaxID=84632 RepID=A0ABT9PBB6_9ACTN|nr:serine/threonine-protein kinase [Kineosporia succinea]MDP9829989.1 serine/threonine protein kinase [Kineosporia succinea]
MYDLRPGDPEQIGDFAVVGRLGGGGMGTVYMAESRDGTRVAIKVVHEYLAADPEFRRRFAHEVDSAGKISGTYTAEVLTADTEARLPWMATEFVEGRNLLQTVDADGPLSPQAVLHLAAGVADALTEIHRAGVIHRDLKPSNILLSPQGPRVIDFGIARAAEASTVTSTGKITGSAAYMSPEQAVGQRVGPATDIFSLGALLYYAATGEPAFGTGPATAMLYRTVHGEVDLTPIPSAPLRDLIAALLEKDPADRPNAKHVAIAARTGQPVTRLPRSTPPAGVHAPTPSGGLSAYDQLMDQVAIATASRGNPIIQPTQTHDPVSRRRQPSAVQLAVGAALLVVLIAGSLVLFQPDKQQKAPAADVSSSEEQPSSEATTDAPGAEKGTVRQAGTTTPTNAPTTSGVRPGASASKAGTKPSVSVTVPTSRTVSPTPVKTSVSPTPPKPSASAPASPDDPGPSSSPETSSSPEPTDDGEDPGGEGDGTGGVAGSAD